ncbi:hypothetical protein GBC03_25270 [Citrobacter telavivensis]|uniref:Uncharacterized protein n=1 Tax=Citrobacter telavivensis TaxID=2653932 RepID=A0A6L5E8T1_9ENTR|nr:hypothetical protein [Citrobacter telavivensis]QFS73280.1 hypothetical protein GBC03_25270 [Citrobacter telavivensis]
MLSGGKRRDTQLLSFYSTRHHPFTKQVHSPPHTIILIRTKEFRRHFKNLCCKHNNTTDGIANLHTHHCVVQIIITQIVRVVFGGSLKSEE